MENLELQAQVTIKKASHMGMCFGVRDAIDLVEKRASKAKAAYTEHSIVSNCPRF